MKIDLPFKQINQNKTEDIDFSLILLMKFFVSIFFVLELKLSELSALLLTPNYGSVKYTVCLPFSQFSYGWS